MTCGTRRRAFSLAELVVVLLVGIVAIMVAYSAVHLMVIAESSADKKSTRTLAEARLSEILMRDLRSSTAVTRLGATDYTITRWVLENDKMVQRDAVWKVLEKVKVVRELPGESPMVFDFDGLLNPDEPAFKFRVEKPDDVVAPDTTRPVEPSPSPEPGP